LTSQSPGWKRTIIGGSADVEVGGSTCALEAPDRLTVTDSVRKDNGSWRVFATLCLQQATLNQELSGAAYAAGKKRGPGLASRPSLSGSPLLKLLTQ
jgi:hypothetical protein